MHARAVRLAVADRVNIRDDDAIGRPNAPREVVHEQPRAAALVRLENAEEPALRELLPRGVERDAHLGRMVAVIVEDHHPGGLAEAVEAPAGAAEFRQRLAHVLPVHVEEAADRDARRARCARCSSPARATRRRRCSCRGGRRGTACGRRRGSIADAPVAILALAEGLDARAAPLRGAEDVRVVPVRRTGPSAGACATKVPNASTSSSRPANSSRGARGQCW